jgi:hypothetical protein
MKIQKFCKCNWQQLSLPCYSGICKYTAKFGRRIFKLDDNLGNRTVLVFGLDFVLTARERSEMGYIEQAQAYYTYAYTFGKYYKQLKNKFRIIYRTSYKQQF